MLENAQGLVHESIRSTSFLSSMDKSFLALAVAAGSASSILLMISTASFQVSSKVTGRFGMTFGGSFGVS
jgi:hypothetical protein